MTSIIQILYAQLTLYLHRLNQVLTTGNTLKCALLKAKRIILIISYNNHNLFIVTSRQRSLFLRIIYAYIKLYFLTLLLWPQIEGVSSFSFDTTKQSSAGLCLTVTERFTIFRGAERILQRQSRIVSLKGFNDP